ncbi:MAG: GNAT family N-acetyltransferase [Thermoleophilia bacterium]|nr:GNAT family N-acetyltransferase [Thermoleophilia bacterium]
MSSTPAPSSPSRGASTAIDAHLTREWTALADRVGAPPSLYPQYVQAWARCYAPDAKIEVATAWEGDRLAGVMPLALHEDGRATGMAEAEDFGIVAVDTATATTVAASALELDARPFVLAPLIAGGDAVAALTKAAGQSGHSVATRRVADRPMVDTAGTWDDYWAERGGKLRGEVRRVRRRLEETGELTEDSGLEIDDLEALLAECMDLEASGWKGEQGSALAQREHERALYLALARWSAERGWLRVPTLRLDGAPIAFQFNVEAHGVKYGLKMGYARELRKFAPGMLLLATEIERAFGDPAIELYDLEGDMSEAYKARWATSSREYIELTLFSPTAAGRAAWLVQSRLRPALGRAKRALSGQ